MNDSVDFDSTDAPEAPVWMDGDQAQAWKSGYAAAVNDMRKVQPERETFPAPLKWSHIELPQGTVMIRRFDVREGDRVVSSHYGYRKVIEVLKGKDSKHVVELRFEGHGEVMTHLVPVDPNRKHIRNERYDGDSLIPLLPTEA